MFGASNLVSFLDDGHLERLRTGEIGILQNVSIGVLVRPHFLYSLSIKELGDLEMAS